MILIKLAAVLMNLINKCNFNFIVHFHEVLILGAILLIIFNINKFWKFNDNKTLIDNKFIPKRTAKQNESEDSLPLYPNGWGPVFESRDLLCNQVKSCTAFGSDLVIFRGMSGKCHVMDAYCPHLGANLGFGGKVVGESVKCPFHGWTFDEKGVCTEVPGLECSSLPKARIKVWESIEMNGFVFVWYHSRDEKPSWYPKRIEKIETSNYVYRGRREHSVYCHVQEVAENAADSEHFHVIHTAPEFLGLNIYESDFYKYVKKLMRFEWKMDFWKPLPEPNGHSAQMSSNSQLYLLGHSAVDINTTINQLCPLHDCVTIDVKSFVGLNAILLMGIHPIGPKNNKIIVHCYTRPTLLGWIFSIYVKYAFSQMVDRDIYIWDKKIYLSQPYYTSLESTLKKFRKWMKQFY